MAKNLRSVDDWAAKLTGLDSQQMAVVILAHLTGYKHKSKHAAADLQRLASALHTITGMQESAEIDAILDRLGRDIPVALDHVKEIVERLRGPLAPKTEA